MLPNTMLEETEELRSALEMERRLRLQSIADLQEFTSKVCHDLREPLRTVSAYCTLLSTADAHGPEADQYRRFIFEAVDRAQSLLSAMLEYTTADYEKRHQVAVDMNAVFREAGRRAGPENAGPDARFIVDPLPAVMGDFQSLVKVARHLLENAIKFSGKGEEALVHVSAKRDGSDWIFAVRDNGPGIDPPHSERIFGAFKRLHGREYPGHGLGLAFCKKAIEWHGGRIWVESTSGEGATFYFNLSGVED